MGASDETSTIDDERRAPPRPDPGLVLLFSGVEPVFRVHPIGRGLTVGREMEGAPPLPDRSLSREHAIVRVSAGGITIQDDGSRNGTFAGGERVTGTARVEHGAVLRFGQTLALAVPSVRPFLDRPSLDDGERVAGPATAAVFAAIARAAKAARTLLITGETGTGKELAAAAFHARGPVASGPRVVVNCAAVPHAVAERLLFGAVRGAYSGAASDAAGHVQAADGGVLFLDELGELEPEVQAKLLRVLETQEVTMLGASRAQRVNVRFCFATHRDLRSLVAEGRFRGDLYFRLARPAVHLPALRDRREEIPALVSRAAAAVAGSPRPHARFVEACLLRRWPGNVRELLSAARDAADRAAARGDDRVLEEDLDPAAGLDPSPAPAAPSPAPNEPAPDAEAIRAALRAHRTIAAAARALGLHRTQLYRLMKRHDLRAEDP